MEYVLFFTKKLHYYAGKILYWNLLGMAIISLLEGIGVILLIPILSTVGITNTNLGSIPYLSAIFSSIQAIPIQSRVLLIMGLYILLVICQAVIQRNLSLRDIKLHTGFINYVRLETYQALLQANWSFFTKKRKSDLINSLTSELGRVTAATQTFLQFITSFVFTIIQIGLSVWLSAKLTLYVLICGLVLAGFSRTFIKKSGIIGNRTTELAQSYLAGITDHFNGIKDIKSNMLEESRYKWLLSWCNEIAGERIATYKLGANSQLLYKASSACIVATFIYLSVIVFKNQGGQLLLIVLIFTRLWPRFTTIQTNLEQISSSIPAFKSLFDLQKECLQARELVDKQEVKYSNVKPLNLTQMIQCEHVFFRYNKSIETYALVDVNIVIPANCMTAIVGRSGAGKSTLVDLLMGLMEPEEGQVLLDGIPLNQENLLSLRKSISYVPQDPFLFNGTIRDNLLMVEPLASENKLWEALDFASAEFVKDLSHGLDTEIGDRGIRLSGGERQRLVLARAILRRPSILVLDEATSALDTENEARIQSAIERLKGKMTLIVIAHRLSTIRNADQVIVIDNGRIVQTGEFGQLAKEKRGMFNKLLNSQLVSNTFVIKS